VDSLNAIISTFTKVDASEFSVFINRQKLKANRKDLELFQLLYRQPELAKQSFLSKLYPDGNKVAYHALRKKLMKHLTDFIYFKQLREDDTAETQVSAYISLSRFLLDRGIIKEAWKNLKKAEQLAVSAELFALANQISRLQLEMPLALLKQDVDEILERKNTYLKLAIEDDRADTAYKIIQHHLQQAKSRVDAPDLRTIIESTLRDFQLDQAMSRRPSIVYKVMSIARGAAKSEKDYYHFEPLAMQLYDNITLSTASGERDKVFIARIQYIIAHTLFRNKKFSKAQDYLKLLRQQLRGVSKAEYVRLLPRSIQLYAATRFFSGYINEAIRIVDAAFLDKMKMKPEDALNLILNQAIYHFYNEDYKQAANLFRQFSHSNMWYVKVAGVEWVIKKDLLDVFIHFELGNYDIASNRIRAILRQKQLFDAWPQLNRVKTFLQLINQIVDDPEVASSPDFYDAVEEAFDWIPIEQEDLHASVYYAWMKSKIVGQPAYKVLLELISIE